MQLEIVSAIFAEHFLFDHRQTENRNFLWLSDPQTHDRCMFCAVYDRHGVYC